MSEVPKQEDIDKIHPLALEDFYRLLKESGKSELMFKISHEGVQFLVLYQMMKEEVELAGFTLPEIFKNTTVTFN
jgi:hypothetical protein